MSIGLSTILGPAGASLARGAWSGLLPASVTEGFWHRFWLRAPAGGDVGHETDVIFMWLWWFCLAWFVVLMVVMGAFVVRYRRAKVGPVAPASPAHNTTIEVLWTVLPSLCLIPMFVYGYHGYMDKLIAPGDAVEMNLTGQKWSWSLTYPDGGESPATTTLGAKEIPVFYMPARKAIRLRMISKDVMHAFWLPDFRVKQDVLPNRYMSVWFEAVAPAGDRLLTADNTDPSARSLVGTPYHDYWIFCAEYCGDEHSEMAAIMRVVPEDKFNAWRGAVREFMDTKLTPAQRGEMLHRTRCASCHNIQGKGTGPEWKNLYNSKRATNAGEVTANPDYIRESIYEPASKIATGYGNQMTSFKGVLTEKQVNDLIAYMRTISDLTPPGELAPPADTPGGTPGEKPADKPADTPTAGGAQK